jgi:Flp pilus assembly protein TadD
MLELQLQLAPEDTRARMILAGEYAKLGRRAETIRELEKVSAAPVADPPTIYGMACAYVILGMKETAIETIERAVIAGYSDWDNLIRDRDLAPIRDEPRFRRLIESSKTRTLSGPG